MRTTGYLWSSAYGRLPAILFLGVCVPGLLSSCKSWAKAGEHRASIDAPAAVHRGEKLIFRVQVQDAAGSTLSGVSFQWQVQWNGIEGMLHKGKSGEELKINVKGAPGDASVHVFGYDEHGNVAEMGKRSFKVE
jgi:hypothetical protein